jgi:hypothetical protein
LTEPPRDRWLAVFGLPIVVGVVSAAGLLSALLLGASGRIFSWFALGLPLAIAVFAYWRCRR